ncbi:MAG: hypothetical protein AABX05_04840 [Nanoarchaeota archaeon]
MSVLVYLIIAIVLGLNAVLFLLKAKKYSVEETEHALKFNLYGVIVLSLGFIIHIIGELTSVKYGSSTELAIESFAHVVIFCSFILFYYSAKHAVEKSKGYWFK